MKSNNRKGNNPLRDEWETPSWIFDPLMAQYVFGFDCCATEKNTKTKEFSKEDFQDIKEVDNIAWMNPPFSKAYAMFRHFFKVIKKGVAIYRCDNLETALWAVGYYCGSAGHVSQEQVKRYIQEGKDVFEYDIFNCPKELKGQLKIGDFSG